MSRDQAGTLHSGHYSTNVQDPCAKRTDTRLQPIGVISGRNQVQRRASDPTGYPTSGMFSLYLAIETTEDPVAAETATEYLQLVHHRDRDAAVRRAFHLSLLFSEGGDYLISQVGCTRVKSGLSAHLHSLVLYRDNKLAAILNNSSEVNKPSTDDNGEEEPFEANIINSSVYIIAMSLQVSTFAINYRVRCLYTVYMSASIYNNASMRYR